MFEREFTLKQLDKVVEDFLTMFKAHSIFLFYGEVGSGKTTFIQSFCRQLGVESIVSSPTFSIVNEYCSQLDGKKIFHLDLYRLRNEEELLSLGFDFLSVSDSICLIEWATLIEPFIEEESVKIELCGISEAYRKIQATTRKI